MEMRSMGRRVAMITPLFLAVSSAFPLWPLSPTKYQTIWLGKNLCLRDRITPAFGWRLNHGDLVVFIDPTDPDKRGYGRIVGKAGDVIQPISLAKRSLSIPDGHVWIEQEQSQPSLKSQDSNEYGAEKDINRTDRVKNHISSISQYATGYARHIKAATIPCSSTRLQLTLSDTRQTDN